MACSGCSRKPARCWSPTSNFQTFFRAMKIKTSRPPLWDSLTSADIWVKQCHPPPKPIQNGRLFSWKIVVHPISLGMVKRYPLSTLYFYLNGDDWGMDDDIVFTPHDFRIHLSFMALSWSPTFGLGTSCSLGTLLQLTCPTAMLIHRRSRPASFTFREPCSSIFQSYGIKFE